MMDIPIGNMRHCETERILRSDELVDKLAWAIKCSTSILTVISYVSGRTKISIDHTWDFGKDERHISIPVNKDYRLTIEEMEEAGKQHKVRAYVRRLFSNAETYVSLNEAMEYTRKRVYEIANKHASHGSHEKDVNVVVGVKDYLTDVHPQEKQDLLMVHYMVNIEYDGDAGRVLRDPSIVAMFKDGSQYKFWNVFDYGTCETNYVREEHKETINKLRGHFGCHIRM